MNTEKEFYRQPEMDLVELSLEGNSIMDVSGKGHLPGYEEGED